MIERYRFDLAQHGFGSAPVKQEGGSTPYDLGVEPAEIPEEDRDDCTLPSGLSFYAHQGIVGIDKQGRISEGYDGGVETETWTAEQRRELSDLMIERWRKFGLSEDIA